MALGMEVGLGPVHTVLDGDTARLPKKGAEPTIFWPMNLSQQWLFKVILQYHNENSAKNRLNLLHIIIFATSVGQTSCTISH